jgi:hypothetical protein
LWTNVLLRGTWNLCSASRLLLLNGTRDPTSQLIEKKRFKAWENTLILIFFLSSKNPLTKIFKDLNLESTNFSCSNLFLTHFDFLIYLYFVFLKNTIHAYIFTLMVPCFFYLHMKPHHFLIVWLVLLVFHSFNFIFTFN